MADPVKLFDEFVEPLPGIFGGEVKRWEVEKFPFHAIISELHSGEFEYRLYLSNYFGSPLPCIVQGRAERFGDARVLLWEEAVRLMRSLRYFIRESEDE